MLLHTLARRAYWVGGREPLTTLSTGGGYGDVGLGSGNLPIGGTVELRCRSTVDMDQVEMGQGLQRQALGLGGAQSFPRTRCRWPEHGREDGQDEVIAYLREDLALDGLVGLRTRREGVEKEDRVHAGCFMGCWGT